MTRSFPGGSGRPPDEVATLCHPVRNGEVLLIRKQRGPGAGNLVGPGGTVETGESPREAAIRETREETGLRVDAVEKVGDLRFVIDGFVRDTHVYISRKFDGVIEASPEGVPGWYDVYDLPTDEMWAGDRHWLPRALRGEPIRGRFVYEAGALREFDLDHSDAR